jgi:WhiB family redox-sensing transcriptional regulator
MTPARFSKAETWKSESACLGADPSVFLPAEATAQPLAPAICGGCAVRVACGDNAVNRPARRGRWGGITDHERRQRRADSEWAA